MGEKLEKLGRLLKSIWALVISAGAGICLFLLFVLLIDFLHWVISTDGWIQFSIGIAMLIGLTLWIYSHIGD